MKRTVVHVPAMPVANPTYSQAIRAGNMLFVAGQIGLDYTTGQLVGGGIREETRLALENLSAVLEAGGSSLERVVSVTVFIKDWGDWAAFNEVSARYFPQDGPAKTTSAVSQLAFDARIEMQAIALVE